MNIGEYPADAKSTPAYPFQHSGPALVVGSAWTFPDDLERANRLFKSAPIFAVNAAAGYLKADFIVSLDRGHLPGWIKAQENFGPGHFSTHSWYGGEPRHYPGIDYIWTGLHGGGTSSWLAARIAALMGFAPIILCGAPLSRGPYHDGADDWSRRTDKHLMAYREPVQRDTWMHPITRSMSGWTAELLGQP